MAREILQAQADDSAFLHEICLLVLQSRPDLATKTEPEQAAMAHWEIAMRAQSAFVAWEGGKRTGALWLYGENETFKRRFMLRGIGVLPDYQRNGIGTALLEHALHYCQQQTGEVLTLEVTPDNKAAINLYRKFGFEVTMLTMRCKLNPS